MQDRRRSKASLIDYHFCFHVQETFWRDSPEGWDFRLTQLVGLVGKCRGLVFFYITYHLKVRLIQDRRSWKASSISYKFHTLTPNP